jgi:hypothetical protein
MDFRTREDENEVMVGILIEYRKVVNRGRHGSTAAGCGENPESAIMAKTATRRAGPLSNQPYAMAHPAVWRHE